MFSHNELVFKHFFMELSFFGWVLVLLASSFGGQFMLIQCIFSVIWFGESTQFFQVTCC